MPSEDTNLNTHRQSFGSQESRGVVLHRPSRRVARKGGPRARPSLTRKLLLAMFALGTAASAGLTWLTTAGFRSDAAETVAVRNPRPTGMVANSHSAVQQLEPNAESIDRSTDPALIKGAGLERWWMDVLESVRPEE
jgi:hypothetical protein